ncbi:polysulfide reductase NrfD [Anopheles sinensis]|uniref:Polysulfide reductase NrfD n=1 Tax=Anopheles sinensis TaxID=74873 RepID=A0A084WTE6_ANOSI|nr:polysulfide reductase NrfD [Anopheles sinensis]
MFKSTHVIALPSLTPLCQRIEERSPNVQSLYAKFAICGKRTLARPNRSSCSVATSSPTSAEHQCFVSARQQHSLLTFSGKSYVNLTVTVNHCRQSASELLAVAFSVSTNVGNTSLHPKCSSPMVGSHFAQSEWVHVVRHKIGRIISSHSFEVRSVATYIG